MTTLLSEQALTQLRVLANASPRVGAFVEVGVYKGGSASVLYAVARSRVSTDLYLYDTFNGHPHDEEGRHHKGAFMDAITPEKLRRVMPGSIVIPGVFPETFVPPLDGIAFAHVDVDQYQSTRDALQAIRPHMVSGGIIVCDDVGHDDCDGATRAWEEVVGPHQRAWVVI